MNTLQKLHLLSIPIKILSWYISGIILFGTVGRNHGLSVSEEYRQNSQYLENSTVPSFTSSWTRKNLQSREMPGDLQLNVGSCDGDLTGLGFGITAPIPPQPYDLPAEAYDNCVDAFSLISNKFGPEDQPTCVIVHNAVQLQEQVADTQSKLIILADGEYDAEDLNPPYDWAPEQLFLKFNAGHRLWAANPGQATLHFGIDLGGNGVQFAAPELHGLVFDIQDANHGAINVNSAAAPTIAVSIWGDTHDAVIEDVQLNGHKQIERGIEAANRFAADGLLVRRIIVDGFSRFGILIQYCEKDDPDDYQCNGNSVDNPVVVEDVVVQNIGGFFDHTDLSENENVGIILGAAGRLSRARVRDVTRVGIATQGTMNGGILEDLDVDRIGVGTHFVWGRALYMENTAMETEFRRFCVGSSVQVGLISEWDNCAPHLPDPQCFPRGIDNTVRDGLIQSYFIGINFDQGTAGGHIENVTFRNAAHVGIVMYNNVDSTQINNTFNLPAGSCSVTTKHWNAENPCDFMPWQTWR